MNAKTPYLFFSCILLLYLCVGLSQAAELSVGNTMATLGETVAMPIQVDDPSQIAAAVFSVGYDPDHLELVDADVSFFHATASHWNDDHVGTIMFCGGKDTPSGTSGPVTILTLEFKALDRIDTTGDYPITLAQSFLYFPAAGYNGNGVPVLTGGTAPPYHSVVTSQTFPGQLSIDRDNDGLTDTEENTYGTDMDNPQSVAGIPDAWLFQYFPGLQKPLAFDPFEDADSDGCSNIRELLLASSPTDGFCESGVLLTTSDADTDVDGLDLQRLAAEMGRDCIAAPPCLCDYTGDNWVDAIDLGVFVEEFGIHE